jgi:hypothetical protein
MTQGVAPWTSFGLPSRVAARQAWRRSAFPDMRRSVNFGRAWYGRQGGVWFSPFVNPPRTAAGCRTAGAIRLRAAGLVRRIKVRLGPAGIVWQDTARSVDSRQGRQSQAQPSRQDVVVQGEVTYGVARQAASDLAWCGQSRSGSARPDSARHSRHVQGRCGMTRKGAERRGPARSGRRGFTRLGRASICTTGHGTGQLGPAGTIRHRPARFVIDRRGTAGNAAHGSIRQGVVSFAGTASSGRALTGSASPGTAGLVWCSWSCTAAHALVWCSSAQQAR